MPGPVPRKLAQYLLGAVLLIAELLADPNVAVVATADPSYTQRKYEDGEVKAETYVFAQGSFFKGAIADRSIERMSFRQLVGYLAPHLAKQRYFPTPEMQQADLLLVVHWGTTHPRVSTREMSGWTSSSVSTEQFLMQRNRGLENGEMTGIGDNGVPEQSLQLDDALQLPTGYDEARDLEFDELQQMTDQLSDASRYRSNVSMLGYGRTLRSLGRAPWQSAAESTLRHDINSERYFVIIEAYEMVALRENRLTPDPVWKMHLNIGTPGNNFRMAMSRMSFAAVPFLGRSTDGVMTQRTKVPEVEVIIEPLIILGEVE